MSLFVSSIIETLHIFLTRQRFPRKETEGLHGSAEAHDGNDAWGHAHERRPRWHDGKRRWVVTS